MSEILVRVVVEVGYLRTRKQENMYYPHRGAMWGHKIVVRGPSNHDWDTEILRFKDFIRWSHNLFIQVNKLSYWKMPKERLVDDIEKNQPWGQEIVVWDHGRQPWPCTPWACTPPYSLWVGGNYRGMNYPNYPLPPSVAYRYIRICNVPGRKHYGYLRGIEFQFCNYNNPLFGERLPFHVHPSRLPSLHSTQITEPLQRSGMNRWHQQANLVREVVLAFRKGKTRIYEVTGYGVGGTTTTARNFSLPVV